MATDMAASHMSGLPVRPSAVPGFRFMYSESTRSDLVFESQAYATSIVPSIATWLRHRRRQNEACGKANAGGLEAQGLYRQRADLLA
jgi:hypothetical protein